MPQDLNIAIVGAGMAAISCARTLVQAGHRVSVFEKTAGFGGRMATRESAFGSFDHGAQYFTVRDARFTLALETATRQCRPWSANAVRVMDELGRVAEAARSTLERHWVAAPDMTSLVTQWARPLVQAQAVTLQTEITRIERDALDRRRWQLRSAGTDGSQHVYSGFDAVLLAIPAAPAQALLAASELAPKLQAQIAKVDVAPCWTLMLAFPNASQPGMGNFGPQWNAALSTHHRIAWLARESSKPRRGSIERWTVQASPAWSQEHLHDDPERVQAKLTKAFSEVTGIRAEPGYAEVFRWDDAKTLKPLGKSHLWEGRSGIGLAGDWCLGHRVEDAFISGLELALAVIG